MVADSQYRRGARGSDASAQFELDKFLPYEIRCFYMQVSAAVAAAYEGRYRMSPAEWRVLATIAFHGKTTSAHIAIHATTDKVTVSRALAKLEDKGWVKICSAESDRRRKHLSLTAAGRGVYNRIVPSVLEVESRLLEGVSKADLAALQRVMQQMINNGAGLESH